jgi:hypothetical protein
MRQRNTAEERQRERRERKRQREKIQSGKDIGREKEREREEETERKVLRDTEGKIRRERSWTEREIEKTDRTGIEEEDR